MCPFMVVIVRVRLRVRVVMQRVRTVIVVMTMIILTRVTALWFPAALDQRELRCRHAGPQDARRRELVALNRETAQGRTQHIQRQTSVQQRAQNHVAGGACEAIEVQQLAHVLTRTVSASWRAAPTATPLP